MKTINKKILSCLMYITMLILSFAGLPHTETLAAAVTPESGNIYYIKNKNSGLYLQVENNASSAGANVIQSKGTGAVGQRWILEQNNRTGYYRLHPATDMTGGISLDVVNGSSAPGTNIQIYTNNGLSAQNFSLIPSGDGYAICTEVSGFSSCLDVLNFSKDSGANVIEYPNNGTDNQIWYFEQAPWPNSNSSSSSNSSYTTSTKVTLPSHYPVQEMTFVSTSDGQYVTGSSSINNTVSSNSTASTANRWVLQKVDSDSYLIVNSETGYVLAPTNNTASSDASVVTTGVADTKAQYWKIIAVKNDCYSNGLNYKVVNATNTDLALTLSNNGYKLSKYTGSASQCFRFNAYGVEGFAGYCKDMNGNEKASVTGGILGDVVTATSISELQKYASGSTPYTIIISNNISANALTKVNVGKNKTFIGSYSAHTLHNIHFRNISSSGNNIYKNITFSHSVEINNNDDIQMYISDGMNFWIDHCSFTGHNMSTDTAIHANDTDKFLYVGLNASFVTVNGSYFGGHKYGIILGYPQEDGANTYDGYPCMTICNNYFNTTKTRAPGLMRYGYFHCYNNFVYDFDLGYTPYTHSKIYSERNYFDKGEHKGAVVNIMETNAQFLDKDSYSTSPIQSMGNLTWNPISNYGYATRNASSAKSWCQSHCGAQSSKLVYAID